MSLPSRYSHKPVAHSTRRGKYTLADLDKNAVEIGHHKPRSEDKEGDVGMEGDDSVVNYVSNERRDNRFNYTESLLETGAGTYNKNPPKVFLVVDTNFILSHLGLVDELMRIAEGVNGFCQIIIPITVMNELDGLKQSDEQQIARQARLANDWIYTHLSQSRYCLRGQRLTERMDRTAVKDDSILDAALYYQRTFLPALVVVLSNDVNFCSKSLANGVHTISYRGGMSASLIMEKLSEEAAASGLAYDRDQEMDEAESQSHLVSVPRFDEADELIYREIQTVVFQCVDEAMKQEFGDDLEMIGYVEAEVDSFEKIFDILKRYWISVFSPFFRRSPINPVEMRNNHEIRSVCDMPHDILSLREFKEFWLEFLWCIYQTKEKPQQKALAVLDQRWTHVMDSIQL